MRRIGALIRAPIFLMPEVKKLSRVLGRLSTKTLFPIDPNEVAEMLCGLTPIDCFRFIKVDIDDNVLKGGFVNSKLMAALPSLYGEALNVACIFYSKHLSKSWERFCIIKEAMHGIDPKGISTITSPEHLISLVDHLSLTRDVLYTKFVKGITEETIKPIVDTMGDWRALLVMVPEKEREQVLGAFHRHEMTIEQIAEYFEIPKHYASAILDNDFWDFIMSLWLGLDEFLVHKKSHVVPSASYASLA